MSGVEYTMSQTHTLIRQLIFCLTGRVRAGIVLHNMKVMTVEFYKKGQNANNSFLLTRTLAWWCLSPDIMTFQHTLATHSGKRQLGPGMLHEHLSFVTLSQNTLFSSRTHTSDMDCNLL